MDINFKYILRFEFIFYLFILIASIIFLIWLIEEVKNVMKKFKSLINYVCIALILIWIYQSFNCYLQEFSYCRRFDADFILNITVLVCLIDTGTWIIYKSMQAYAKKNVYKYLDIENPKRLRKEIESLVNKQNSTQNKEMEKLYKTLQISALSLKEQQKLVRSSFVKNIIISILFFIFGLIIPKLIMLILSKC